MTRQRILYTVAAAALLVAVAPAVAVAQTDRVRPTADERVATNATETDGLERAKAHVARQIERRLGILDRLAGKTESAKRMTEAHAAALRDDIAAAREILHAGIAAVEAVTTPEELRAVTSPIFENTLVFALLAPKTHAVAASDATNAASERFSGFGGQLQRALDRIAAETDVDTSEAQAKLNEMLRLANQAATAGGPVADNVIGLQPEDWPDPAEGALRAGKAALDEARDSLRAARTLGHEVIEFIRSVVGDRAAEDA